MTLPWRITQSYLAGAKASKDNHTKLWMWDWQCKVFVYSCYLYDQATPAICDSVFDDTVRHLLQAYDELPEWFTARVPKEQLEAGTSVGLSFSEQEKQAALDWLRNVTDLNNSAGRSTPHQYNLRNPT